MAEKDLCLLYPKCLQNYTEKTETQTSETTQNQQTHCPAQEGKQGLGSDGAVGGYEPFKVWGKSRER